MSDKEHSWNSYYLVFNALILLTVISVGLSFFDVGELLINGSEFGHSIFSFLPVVDIGHGANIVLGLIVAMIKASLVLWFFMHQDHEEGINRFIVGLQRHSDAAGLSWFTAPTSSSSAPTPTTSRAWPSARTSAMRRAAKALGFLALLALPALAFACPSCKDAFGDSPEAKGFANGIYYTVILLLGMVFTLVGILVYKIVQEANTGPLCRSRQGMGQAPVVSPSRHASGPSA